MAVAEIAGSGGVCAPAKSNGATANTGTNTNTAKKPRTARPTPQHHTRVTHRPPYGLLTPTPLSARHRADDPR